VMANDLTGDFDVVAEFTLGAANRVLAAMHRGNRFPHSLSLRVTDSHKAHGIPGRVLVAVSVVDKFGQPTVNPALLSQLRGSLRLIPPSNPLFSALDALANAPRRVHSEASGLGEYTGLEGIAQLQLSTPTITIPDQSGTRLTAHIQMMAHWFADPDTPPIPEFLRGEVQITVGVDQVASQVGNVVDISLHSKNVEVTFRPDWYSRFGVSRIGGTGGGLGPTELNKINQVIRNAITTSFQPSNAALPSSVQSMQFKGLAGGSPAIGVLINVNDGPGDPGSVNNVFLGDGDDFAYAASGDFILGTFNSLVNQLKGLQVNFTSTLADYKATVNSVKIELQEGQILLTVDGHAHTGSIFPDFSFTVRQAFTLSLVDSAGNLSGPLQTAQLALLGDISLDIHRGGLAGAIINAFRNQVVDNLRQVRDQAVAGMQGTFRYMLNADRNLGGFLKSLMNPTNRPAGAPPLEELDPDLEYTSFEIHPSGIVLHGSLAVPEWPAVHAEFEITPNDYNALNSWIPGGTIHRYTWIPPGQSALRTEPNTFVFVDPRPARVNGMNICVRVEGTRISASGPVAEHPVSATACRWISIPLTIPEDFGHRTGRPGLADVALTRFTDSGALEVVGHTSPWASASGASANSANWIIHFPDEKSLGHLDHLATAARQSERADATTAILAVLAPDQLAKVKPTGDLLFADDQDRAWEHLLEVTRRPATVVIGASGQVVWRHEGELAIAALADALRIHLVASGSFRPRLLQLSVRVGQFPPNFVFDYAPDREMPLRKLVGRPVILVFWKSSSKPSLETLRELQKTNGKAGGRGPLVLAINDGEPAELANKVAAGHKLSAIVVTDPEREIALAYGVTLWPTTIFVDALGVVRDIQYGLFSVEQLKQPIRGESGPGTMTEEHG
jgi:peroxiredoxin